MKKIGLFCLAFVVTLGMIGCGGTTPQQESGTDAKPSSTQPFEAHFDVVMENGTKKYDPMSLTVTGDHGTVTVTNKLDAEHGFVIREFDIEEAVPAGETLSFDVRDVAPGEYPVDCHLHSAHEEATLVVKGSGS